MLGTEAAHAPHRLLQQRRIFSSKLRTPELARLPRISNGKPQSIAFRRIEPASVSHLVNQTSRSYRKLLDPSHPLVPALRNKRVFTFYRSAFFTWAAYPNGLLAPADMLPPFNNYSHLKEVNSERSTTPTTINKRIITMPLLCILGKKSVHNSAFIRKRIARRVQEGLKFIIIRGAMPNADSTDIQFQDTDAGAHQWLLQDWTYVVHANLEIYKAPWPQLIEELRKALKLIKQRAVLLEKQAMAASLPSSVSNHAQSRRASHRLTNHGHSSSIERPRPFSSLQTLPPVRYLSRSTKDRPWFAGDVIVKKGRKFEGGSPSWKPQRQARAETVLGTPTSASLDAKDVLPEEDIMQWQMASPENIEILGALIGPQSIIDDSTVKISDVEYDDMWCPDVYRPEHEVSAATDMPNTHVDRPQPLHISRPSVGAASNARRLLKAKQKPMEVKAAFNQSMDLHRKLRYNRFKEWQLTDAEFNFLEEVLLTSLKDRQEPKKGVEEAKPWWVSWRQYPKPPKTTTKPRYERVADIPVKQQQPQVDENPGKPEPWQRSVNGWGAPGQEFRQDSLRVVGDLEQGDDSWLPPVTQVLEKPELTDQQIDSQDEDNNLEEDPGAGGRIQLKS